MATPFPQALDDCRKEEEALSQLLADDNIKFQQIEQSLTRLRAICSDVLLSDFQAATSSGFKAEDRLWDNHQKVNARFRTALANLRNAPGQKAIELRKLGHEYLKFIKISQTFYRNLIKRLNQAYGGIPALERVANKLNSNLRPNAARPTGSPTVAQLELCCHNTLIRLGDLSRYRETELSGTEKNWAPAYGYYDLALTVCPGSGVPFNQRAVIALSDKALFRAIYYVYRSLSAENPHPQGDMNLRRALHKIQQAYTMNKELVNDSQATAGAALPKGMVAWYLRLLEMFYHGKAAPEKEELENEVISQLEVDLEQNPSASSPVKLVVTSIAAQHAAQERFETKQSSSHHSSYVLFLELNVRIFSTLLRIFVRELEDAMQKLGDANGSKNGSASHLTPVLRRLLPAMRLYDLWLEKTCEIIHSPASGISQERKSELWSLYARALTLISTGFPPQDLPSIEHLLEEDEDVIGFRPLYSEKNQTIWYHNGQLKPGWHSVSDETDRSDTQEMLYRVREFIVRGLELVLGNRVPIDFDKDQCLFSHKRAGAPVLVANRKPSTVQTQSSSSPRLKPAPIFVGADEAQDKEAERMVDDIVGKAPESPRSPKLSLDQGQFAELPATPPPRSATRSSFGTASPFPMGTQTVNDIMSISFKQPKPNSPRFQAPAMQQSRSSSRPGSQLQSPAPQSVPPHIPAETYTGGAKVQPRTQFYPEDPQLPGLGILAPGSTPSAQVNVSASSGTRPSPLPPPLSHSRVNSSESTRGIWGGGIFTPSFQPMDARRTSGQLIEGSTEGSIPGPNYVPNSFPEPRTGSPALHSSANVPWNHSFGQQNRAFGSSDSLNRQEGAVDSKATRTPWNTVTGQEAAASWQET